MKNLMIALACIIALNVNAQEGEATTGEFQLDFTTKVPVNVSWVYPTATDTLTDFNDILLKIGIKSASEIVKMSLLVNGKLLTSAEENSLLTQKNHPDYDVYVEQVVTLHKGNNTLKFVAQNATGLSDTKERTILMTPRLDIIPVKVTWLYPAIMDTIIDEKEVTVRIGMKSKSKIEKMSLLVNGLPVSTDVRGENFIEKSHPDYDKYVEVTIPLREGGNVLKFVAQNSNGKSDAKERTIKVVNKINLAIANRKDYALLFATDLYDEWGNLTNPVNDARTIAGELADNYGFKVELVENFNKDEVMIKIREYAEKEYGEYDQLFIFFAGHGQFDELFGQGYIVSKDSKLKDVAKSSYISHNVLRSAIDNIPNQHILLMMDVCYGGTFDPLIARSGSRGNDDLYNDVGLNEYIDRKLKFKTRQYITSGGKEYVSDGRPGMHSPFASKFLEGLRSYGGRDNIITIPELKIWLERLAMEPRAGTFGTNEPGSDFVFVVKDN
jgi:caspase domain-containing protein